MAHQAAVQRPPPPLAWIHFESSMSTDCQSKCSDVTMFGSASPVQPWSRQAWLASARVS